MSDFIIDPVNKGVYSLFLIKEEKQPYIYSGHTYPRCMAQIQFFHNLRVNFPRIEFQYLKLDKG